MKKLILALIGFFFLSLVNLTAQSCCKPTQNCKPKTCCPTKPNCCKGTAASVEATGETENETVTQKESAERREKLSAVVREKGENLD